MAETIRGINVQIGADTTKLGKALENVNAKSKSIQSELRQVERLLKFDPGNTEALAQKQKLLAEQISATSEKLNKLKSVQQQINEQFQKGEISEAKYRAFRREIEFTESSLSSLKVRLLETEKEQQNIAKSTKQLETLLRATGKEVGGLSDVLGGKLTNALLQGKASSKQLEEAIEKIGRAALGTNIDLDKMKQALSSVDDGNSLKNVKKELNQLAKEADEAKKSVGDLGVELENVAGALVAGGGIAGAIDQALDLSSLNTKIEIAFDVPEESMEAVKNAVLDIQAYGLEGEEALEGVRRQWALNKDASDEANAAIVKGAAAIASAYSGIDFTELIQETNEIANELNISKEEALGLTNALLKMGFPPEQLDIIAEYGGQLERAGFNAQEIQAIMAAGVETGTWNIDNLLDGLKEGRIRVAEFGEEVPKALKDLLKGTDISAKQMKKWGQAVAEGGEGGSKAMREIAKALNGVEDETKKNLIGAQIFGTMYEDQGQNIIDTLLNAKTEMVDFKVNQDQLNESVSQMDSSPAVELQQALTDLKTAAEPALSVIADVVSTIANWVSENPKLTAAITSIVSVLGILIGIIMGLAPIFVSLSGLAAAFGVSIAAIAAPIGIAIAAIVGLIAAGIAIWQNWDTIKEKAIEIWSAISEWFSTTLESIKQFFTDYWNNIKDFLSSTWENIKQVSTTVWNTIKTGVMAIITPFINNIINTFNSMKDGLQTMFEGLKQYFSGVWDLIKNIFLGAVLLIVDLVTGDFEGLKEDSKVIFENLKDAFNDIWEGIKKIFSGAVEAAKGYVSAAWENIKSATSTVFNAVSSAISSIWDGIKSFFSTTIENIKSSVSNGFENMKDSVFDKMTAAKQTITDIWNEAEEFLSNIDLKQIGKDIIQGLIDGIGSMASAVLKKVNEIAESIKNTIRNALDINSPSRVMRDEIGKWIPLGLAEGIERNISAVMSATNRMAQATIPSVSGMTVAGGNTTKINVPKMAGAKIEQHFHFQSTSPTPSEVARRAKQASRQLAMEWGL